MIIIRWYDEKAIRGVSVIPMWRQCAGRSLQRGWTRVKDEARTQKKRMAQAIVCV